MLDTATQRSIRPLRSSIWRPSTLNAADLLRRAARRPAAAGVEVAARARSRRIAQRPAGFVGTLCFTLAGGALAGSARRDDLVVAYPTVDRAALRELVRTSRPRARHGDGRLPRAPGRDQGRGRRRTREGLHRRRRRLAPLGGLMTIGAKRSPLHDPRPGAKLAREIVARTEVELDGLMAYEAQIAGVGDRPPGKPLLRARAAGRPGALRARAGASARGDRRRGARRRARCASSTAAGPGRSSAPPPSPP